jgi:hypothetical protein
MTWAEVPDLSEPEQINPFLQRLQGKSVTEVFLDPARMNGRKGKSGCSHQSL